MKFFLLCLVSSGWNGQSAAQWKLTSQRPGQRPPAKKQVVLLTTASADLGPVSSTFLKMLYPNNKRAPSANQCLQLWPALAEISRLKATASKDTCPKAQPTYGSVDQSGSRLCAWWCSFCPLASYWKFQIWISYVQTRPKARSKPWEGLGSRHCYLPEHAWLRQVPWLSLHALPHQINSWTTAVKLDWDPAQGAMNQPTEQGR